MRKLIYSINLSIDGVCDHTKMNGDDVILDYFAGFMEETGVLLYGRITYQLMVPFWPEIAKNNSGTTKAMNDFAKAFDAVPKIVVFSRSLDSVEDKKTSIVRTDLRDEILKLKQEPGKPIFTGGVDLPSQLIELGLVDEYRFVVQPLLVGAGRRLLEDINLPEKLTLKLAGSEVLRSGHLAIRYVKP